MSDTSVPLPRQRFGYVIFTGPDSFDARVWHRDASPENLAELEELTAVLFEVQPFMMAMEGAERSYHELLSAVQDHNEALSKADRGSLTLVHLEGFTAISQRMTAFLACASALLATCEVQLKRVHGEGSAEVTSWLRNKRRLHAEYFAYRFLHDLRNYCQHANLPLSLLKSSGVITEDGSPMLVTSGVFVTRDKLLADTFNWNKKLIPQIQAQAEEFDLMPFATTYVNCYGDSA